MSPLKVFQIVGFGIVLAVAAGAQTLSFTTQANGLQTVVFDGMNYNYIYGEGLLTQVTTATATGSNTVAPTCTGSFTATSVTKTCSTQGTDSLTVTVTFSTPTVSLDPILAAGDVGTIQANVQVTNNSTTETVTSAMLSILGVSMAQYNATSSNAQALSSSNPISAINYQTGQYAIWMNQPDPNISMHVTCAWSYVCKNQPVFTNLTPGQTRTESFSLRFTNNTATLPVNLAPEAYTAFRSVYPPVVAWPDRRPIMAWFVSNSTSTSAVNPRGYFGNPALNVSNTANFKSALLAVAQSVLTAIQARPVQPQGIIIWDLEGQEFVQPTTYIGDPRVLSSPPAHSSSPMGLTPASVKSPATTNGGRGSYDPEMNAAADSLFALFKNAGYRVGMTLRPQYLQWGTELPAQCHYDPSNAYKDYYILFDAAYQHKFFSCYDPAGKVWTLIPNGNGGQTFYTSSEIEEVTNLLISKASYAHSRWGATLFYVDTSVWVGGQPIAADIFRTLQQTFPDCLFLPEESYLATMGVAMPYSDPSNSSAPKFAPVSWRYVYPTGALGIYLGNCGGTCWTNNLSSFDSGQKVGDIAIYPQPSQEYLPQLQAIEALIQQARQESSSITVTDFSSGIQYSYQGSPATIYHYPLKMRVYFAASPDALAASTTYCEAGGWTGGNSCTLNLTGLTNAQIRYYDFSDQLVLSESPQGR